MSSLQAVLLPLGPDRYAVPVGWVREVVPAPSLTPLATAPPLLLGLFNLRGEIVPLLDTATLLGLGAAGAVRFVLVLQSADGLVGLAATGLPQRVLLDHAVGPSELRGTAGTYRVDEQVTVLLDPATVLGGDLLDAAERAAPGGTG